MSGVLQVQPDAFYADEVLRDRLGFSESTMSRARKAGELRYAKRGHRILYRGDWLLKWLEADAAEPSALEVSA